MSEPKYKKGDKVWTVLGDGGTVIDIRHHNNFRKRLYKVLLTKLNYCVRPRSERRHSELFFEPDLMLQTATIPSTSVQADR
jgi:hypothetical protein